MITVLEAIKLSTEYLEKKDVESARANAEILLAEILNCKRLDLYLTFDKPLKENELNLYREFIRKRGMRIPLQYIVGNVEFFGFKLVVNENVLIPRPETEQLVEKIIKDNTGIENLTILDIGVGSGNISIALSNNLKNCKVVGIDISEKALEIAKVNSKKYLSENKVEFKLFDILKDNLANLGKFDLIISNPPYISDKDFEALEPELKNFEPRIALTDSSDGISYYKKIISASKELLNMNGKLYFEMGKDQFQKIDSLMKENGFKNINIIKDYSGIERIISGELK
jgi:release factor glutamine methyltransferase